MADMQDDMKQIADLVRGVAARKRQSQQDIADILGIERKSAGARLNGRVPFSAAEVFRLSAVWGVDVGEFFPRRQVVAA